MKSIHCALTLTLLCACHQPTTSEKITAALKSNLTEGLKKSGQTLESVSIDSLSYYETTLQGYYNDFKKKITTLEDEDANVVEADKSDTVTLQEIRRIQDSAIPYIQKLRDGVDTSVKIYNVDCHMSYKTNKRSMDSHLNFFMYESDLKNVTLNADSIMAKVMGHPVNLP